MHLFRVETLRAYAQNTNFPASNADLQPHVFLLPPRRKKARQTHYSRLHQHLIEVFPNRIDILSPQHFSNLGGAARIVDLKLLSRFFGA